MKLIKLLKKNYIISRHEFPDWLYKILTIFAKIINYFLIHKKQKNDIYIISTFRSGSTWLAEILYNIPKTKYIHEPFSPYKFNIKNNIYPKKPDNLYISLTKSEESSFTEYIKKLSEGKIFISRRYDILSSSFSLKTNRSVFKILRCSPLAEWFVNHYSDYFLFLIRHPLTTSVSKIQTGIKKDFQTSINKYLSDQKYVNKYLNNEILTYLDKNNNVFTELEKETIIWCLDNLPLIHTYSKYKEYNNVALITYEELLAYPENTIKKIGNFLNLTNINKLTENRSNASASVKYNINEKNYKNFEDNFNKLKEKITYFEAKNLIKILDIFNIRIYQYNNFLPVKIN